MIDLIRDVVFDEESGQWRVRPEDRFFDENEEIEIPPE